MKKYRFQLNILLICFLILILNQTISAQAKGSILVNEYQAYLYAVEAHLLELSGNLGVAIQRYQKALEFNPNFDEARLSLAELYLRLAKINEALEQTRYIVKKDKKAFRLMGLCYETLKMLDKALEA